MSNDSDFKLYGFWRTSSTYRVRVALRLKGLTAAEQIVDLEKGEQLSNSFLAINPPWGCSRSRSKGTGSINSVFGNS